MFSPIPFEKAAAVFLFFFVVTATTVTYLVLKTIAWAFSYIKIV